MPLLPPAIRVPFMRTADRMMPPGRKNQPPCSPALTLVFCLVAALLAGACEETVDPILDSDRDFTLFGTLDMARDTQFVRVIPIREQLLADDPGAPLNVVFTSTDLDSDETVVWRDSVITFSNGTVGHVFYAPLRLRAGHSYRIAVQPEGSEIVTSAVTTVPEAPVPVVEPPEVTGGVGGALGRGTQRVLWQGLGEAPFRIELWYRFLLSEGAAFRDVLLPYTPESEPVTDQTWAVTLNLTQDRQTLDTLVVVDETPLMGVGLELTILDAAFVPPGGTFDPEILVQPGTLSNVENGLGFVGAVGRFPVEWVLDEDTTQKLRYLRPDEVFGAAAKTVVERARREAARSPHRRYYSRLQ